MTMNLRFRGKQKTQENHEKKRARGILTLFFLDYNEIYAEQFGANDPAMRMTAKIINGCDAMLRFGGRMW